MFESISAIASAIAPYANAISVILIIVAAGTFGGFVNQQLQESEDRRRLVIMGIGASALVPLFLKLTDSKLLEQLFNVGSGSGTGGSHLANLLVFASMCLLAAIVSERFILSLTEKFLADKIARVEDKIDNPEEPDVEPEITTRSSVSGGDVLTEEEAKVLDALHNKPGIWRARSPIAKEIGFGRGSSEERARLRVVLNGLADKALADVRLSPRDGKPRWRLAQDAVGRLTRDEQRKRYIVGGERADDNQD